MGSDLPITLTGTSTVDTSSGVTTYSLTATGTSVSSLGSYNFYSITLLIVIAAILSIDLLRRLFAKRHD